MVGLSGLEPPTSRLSGVCSNQLSYRPIYFSRVYSLKTEPNNQVCALHDVGCVDVATGRGDFNRRFLFILRKEVIQPHLPIRLPCYDFTPIIGPTLGGWLQKVTSPTSGVTNSRGVTGGVYKARERIHRGMLIRDY